MKINEQVIPPKESGYLGKYADVYRAMDALSDGESVSIEIEPNRLHSLRINAHLHATTNGYKIKTIKDGKLLYITRKELDNE